MKLEDIKNSVIHQCEMNFKRSVFDLSVFRHREHIEGLLRATLNEVYDVVEPVVDSSDEVGKEDIPF